MRTLVFALALLAPGSVVADSLRDICKEDMTAYSKVMDQRTKNCGFYLDSFGSEALINESFNKPCNEFIKMIRSDRYRQAMKSSEQLLVLIEDEFTTNTTEAEVFSKYPLCKDNLDLYISIFQKSSVVIQQINIYSE